MTPQDITITNDVFRDQREFLVRHDLRHLDRGQLEELVIQLCVAHDLFDEITVLRDHFPRTKAPEINTDDLPAADTLVTQEEQRLNPPPP